MLVSTQLKTVETKDKLLLINPANQYRKGFLRRVQSKQSPLGLGIIAALTPNDFKIKIWDENFRPFREAEADLVGITTFTSTAARAYEIADLYRSKGIPVVMGGIHVSSLPEEALQHADAVVIGEAEGIWHQVIDDFKNKRLKGIYQGGLTDMQQSPIPRHDLFHPGYIFGSIQTSRGCPMDCEFCSVPAFNGHKYRLRSIDSIITEMKQIPQKLIYFVDDNIIGYGSEAEKHAEKLFKAMIASNLKKEWFAQASLNIAEKPYLLKLASQAGCRMLLIGIEAEKEEQLKESNKKLNLKKGVGSYKSAFRAIHKARIAVLGAFIFGMDSDKPQDLYNRAEFIMKSAVDVTQASILTPLPGTRLYNKLQSEGRLDTPDGVTKWQYFHFGDVVFSPKQMSAEELATHMQTIYQKITSLKNLRLHFIRTLWNTKSLRTTIWAWNSNINYRLALREKPVKSNLTKND